MIAFIEDTGYQGVLCGHKLNKPVQSTLNKKRRKSKRSKKRDILQQQHMDYNFYQRQTAGNSYGIINRHGK